MPGIGARSENSETFERLLKKVLALEINYKFRPKKKGVYF